MSGSRLGRGRGGRLAVYGGCGVVVVLLVLLYRAATSEMNRLRELHVQCAHQQEALAAQLQVIFEYKVRLEKSLAEEKSSNAAVKQELQQRASREKSLRDKDSIEAMQRFNSLQQSYKLLQTEHQDLQEECKKREKQALEDTNRLETTLQELRSRITQIREEKEKALEDLKNKYLELDTEKTKVEEKYDDILKNSGNADSKLAHLQKRVIQLERELEEAKKSCKTRTFSSSIASPPSLQQTDQQIKLGNVEQPVGPSQQQQQQQSSEPANNGSPASTVSDKPQPLSKPALKAKLPVGVPPIPVMIDQKPENPDENRNEQEVARKKKEEANKQKIENPESKEREVEIGNLELPFPAISGRKREEQPSERKGNRWFNVGPGVQEIGDELNHVRLPGLDDGAERNAEAVDDQYEGLDYDKEPQQKNSDLQLVEGEDEGEDEEDQVDYPHNLKQEKHD